MSSTQAIKEEIAKLSRKEQTEIVHFIMDMMVREEAFALTKKLEEEVEKSCRAIESGEDKGLSAAAYREEMQRFLEKMKKD